MFNVKNMMIREMSFVFKFIFVSYLTRRVFIKIELIFFLFPSSHDNNDFY